MDVTNLGNLVNENYSTLYLLRHRLLGQKFSACRRKSLQYLPTKLQKGRSRKAKNIFYATNVLVHFARSAATNSKHFPITFWPIIIVGKVASWLTLLVAFRITKLLSLTEHLSRIQNTAIHWNAVLKKNEKFCCTLIAFICFSIIFLITR